MNHLVALVKDLELWLGVSLTIKDQSGVLVDGDGNAALSDFCAHCNWYCLFRRPETKSWRRRCMDHCNHDIPQRMAKGLRSVCLACWKGVLEVVVPIMDEGGVGFLMYAGVFREDVVPDFLRAEECPEEYRIRYEQLPALTPKIRERIVQTLTVFGQGILHQVRQQQSETSGTSGIIYRYVREHYTEPVSLDSLAGVLHLSTSRASHLVRDLTGKSLSQLLMEERVRRARNLLISSNLSLEKIAHNTGFCTEYYLSRKFSEIIGVPPARYRENIRRRAEQEG